MHSSFWYVIIILLGLSIISFVCLIVNSTLLICAITDQSGRTLSFAVRLHIALGSSWAIIYLHIGAYLAMDHCAIKAKTTECQTL